MSSDLNSLKRYLRNYYDMRNILSRVVTHLDFGIEKISIVASKISYYSIDDLPADKDIMKNKKKELVAKRDEIINKLLPEVNREINKLKKEIQIQEALLINPGV
jgi:hypothetical protein